MKALTVFIETFPLTEGNMQKCIFVLTLQSQFNPFKDHLYALFLLTTFI